MADKREQVFVSSTYLDLLDERQEVIQTLLEAGCFPAGMELFPASDDDRWTLIKRVIDDSDYYIVVVGGRYGSVDPARGLSYTEMEFDYAVSQRKPVMGFLHGSPGTIEADKTELNEDLRQKLDAFREKVGNRVVKFWSSPQELGGQVAKSLIRIRQSHPAEGWIRAREALTPEVQQELVELRAHVAQLKAELSEQRQVASVVDPELLAQADDVYELQYYLVYFTKEAIKERSAWGANTTRVTGSVPTTWNEILGRLGPLMLDEATEEALDDTLDLLARDRIVEEGLLPEDYGRATELGASLEVLQDVKVQFVTLGLMEQSVTKRRQVADKSSYWTLTARGKDQLMRLRAIRRVAAAKGPAKLEGEDAHVAHEKP